MMNDTLEGSLVQISFLPGIICGLSIYWRPWQQERDVPCRSAVASTWSNLTAGPSPRALAGQNTWSFFMRAVPIWQGCAKWALVGWPAFTAPGCFLLYDHLASQCPRRSFGNGCACRGAGDEITGSNEIPLTRWTGHCPLPQCNDDDKNDQRVKKYRSGVDRSRSFFFSEMKGGPSPK